MAVYEYGIIVAQENISMACHEWMAVHEYGKIVARVIISRLVTSEWQCVGTVTL
jgi:hypothetical protein